MTRNPDLVALSSGAGVQSTAITLLAIDGHLPKPDVAIFSDTGWEPRAVYAQVDRLASACERAGIRFIRVSNGNLRRDAVDPEHRYALIPYFVRNPDGSDGMGRRQCTSEYKLAPITRKVRELLGAKPPHFRRVPKGRLAEQWVGFSTDEVIRANRRRDSQGVQYLTTRYPLLDLGMSREDCTAYLAEMVGETPRRRHASAARTTATGSGESCATTTRMSGPTPSRSTRRSARAALVVCRRTVRRSCTAPGSRCPSRPSTTSHVARPPKTLHGTSLPSSRCLRTVSRRAARLTAAARTGVPHDPLRPSRRGDRPARRDDLRPARRPHRAAARAAARAAPPDQRPGARP